MRFVITHMDRANYHCEIGSINRLSYTNDEEPDSIFRYTQRHFERTNEFNTVLIVPTGIGAEIGGHAGDATPVRVLVKIVIVNYTPQCCKCLGYK